MVKRLLTHAKKTGDIEAFTILNAKKKMQQLVWKDKKNMIY